MVARPSSVRATDANGVTSPSSPPLSLAISALPTVASVTMQPGSADVNQSVQFSALVTGGFGSYSYAWTGLPSTGCGGTTTATVTCTLRSAGPVTASVVATDANGGRSGAGPTVNLEVYPDPVLTALSVSPSSVDVGGEVTFASALSGGSGNFGYNWTGLPTGCTTAGTAATCRPGQTGTYEVTLTATDGNGYSVTSSTAVLTVKVPAATIGLPAPSAFGLPPPLFYAIVGGVAILLAVAAAVVLIRLRRR